MGILGRSCLGVCNKCTLLRQLQEDLVIFRPQLGATCAGENAGVACNGACYGGKWACSRADEGG